MGFDVSAPTSLKAGDPVKAGSDTALREFRKLAELMGIPDGVVVDELPPRLGMEANRAALPTPPAYAAKNLLEHPEGMERREPLKAPAAPPREETIAFLFAQLREMGVGCETCKRFQRTCHNKEDEDDPFLCSAWIGIDGWGASGRSEG